jgi:hypothetical protein
MANVPTWLIGRYLTAISIIPQAVSGGVLSPGTTFALTGLLDEITLDAINDMDDIVPLDIRQNNRVIIGSGVNMTLVEILNQINSTGTFGTGGNCLRQAALAEDYQYVTFTQPSGNVFQEYFVTSQYGEGLRRGKSVGTMQVEPCGISLAYGT